MSSLATVLFLVVIFIIVPIAELYVIIKVGEAIGLVPTLVLLLADALLGSLLLRYQGRAAWIRFNRALAEGRVPHKEVFDGVLVIMGGALLLTPGFLTDIVGLALVLPFTRPVARRLLESVISRRLIAQTSFMGEVPGFRGPGTVPRGGTDAGPDAGRRPSNAGGDVVEGEIIDE